MIGKSLKEKLFEDQKVAMKAKDRFRLTVIRMLRSELQNSEIAKKGVLDEEEELEVITREVKKRQDALVEFEKSGRKDLIEELKMELAILKKYQPDQLSNEELLAKVKAVIDETGAQNIREMGRVMSVLMPRIKGRADGALARKIVEDNLK